MSPATTEASLTIIELIALFKQLLLQTDTVNPPMSSTEIANEINNAYAVWFHNFGQRMRHLNGTVTFGVVGPQAVAGMTGTSNNANILEFQHLFMDGTTSDDLGMYGAELEILGVNDVLALQQGDLVAGTPKYAAVAKLAGTPGNVGSWGLWLYPIPDAAYYIAAMARVEPYQLDPSLPGDRLECTNAEARIVVSIAAGRTAERMRMPSSIVDAIWKTIPSDLQALVRAKQVQEPQPQGKS